MQSQTNGFPFSFVLGKTLNQAYGILLKKYIQLRTVFMLKKLLAYFILLSDKSIVFMFGKIFLISLLGRVSISFLDKSIVSIVSGKFSKLNSFNPVPERFRAANL